ncbi:MAG TPA: HEAT repeat domain-containing protein [Asanoa sp.]|nr:HEAT repeat domain-containing protein [Asanoa sp.]
MADEFARALRLMRRRDPQLAEDGFQRLRGLAAAHVDRLIDEFRRETDHGVRCCLLELIAETRSPRAESLLTAQARSDDESLRDWATQGLRLLQQP